jgi:TRAF3-interacting protein 1
MAVDGAVIKRTQESLGPYVKKPPLTEKLLSKPPFRFLHDVFSTVIKDTGVLSGQTHCWIFLTFLLTSSPLLCFLLLIVHFSLSGLFDEKEMNSENVKDKDAKVSEESLY